LESSLCRRAAATPETNPVDKSLADLEKELAHFKKTGDREGEAAGLCEIGNHLLKRRKWPQAVQALAKAGEIYREEGNTAAQAGVIANMGAVYWQQAQVRKSIQRLQESLDLLSAAGEPAGRAIVTALLGLARWRLGEQKEALALIGEALKQNAPVPATYRPLALAMENARRQLDQRLQGEATAGNPAKGLQAHLALVPVCLCLGDKHSADLHYNISENLAKTLADQMALATLATLSSLLR